MDTNWWIQYKDNIKNLSADETVIVSNSVTPDFYNNVYQTPNNNTFTKGVKKFASYAIQSERLLNAITGGLLMRVGAGLGDKSNLNPTLKMKAKLIICQLIDVQIMDVFVLNESTGTRDYKAGGISYSEAVARILNPYDMMFERVRLDLRESGLLEILGQLYRGEQQGMVISYPQDFVFKGDFTTTKQLDDSVYGVSRSDSQRTSTTIDEFNTRINNLESGGSASINSSGVIDDSTTLPNDGINPLLNETKKIGDLTTLTTVAKDTLVNAINEVNAKPSGGTGGASNSSELIDDSTTLPDAGINPKLLLIDQKANNTDLDLETTERIAGDLANNTYTNNKLADYVLKKSEATEKQSEIVNIGATITLDVKNTTTSEGAQFHIDNTSGARITQRDQITPFSSLSPAGIALNQDITTLQTNIDTEATTRLTNDNLLQDNINVEKVRNDAQDLSILNNTNNIINLNNLVNTQLLFAYRNVNSLNTTVANTPINLLLPSADPNGIFETLDGGITYRLKSGQIITAGTRVFYNIVHNFTLSNVSTNDRGTLNVYNNGVVILSKGLEILPNQTTASFILQGFIDVLIDTGLIAITTTIQADAGNFNATHLKGSYGEIFTKNNGTGSVASTTTNINYDGIITSLVGQNQTQIDNTFRSDIDTAFTRLEAKVDQDTYDADLAFSIEQDANLQTQIDNSGEKLIQTITVDATNSYVVDISGYKNVTVSIRNDDVPVLYTYFQNGYLVKKDNIILINNTKFMITAIYDGSSWIGAAELKIQGDINSITLSAYELLTNIPLTGLNIFVFGS